MVGSGKAQLTVRMFQVRWIYVWDTVGFKLVGRGERREGPGRGVREKEKERENVRIKR